MIMTMIIVKRVSCMTNEPKKTVARC